MAGITNTAFRRLCREYGAGLYVSEMITSPRPRRAHARVAAADHAPRAGRAPAQHPALRRRPGDRRATPSRCSSPRTAPTTSTSTSAARCPRSRARAAARRCRGSSDLFREIVERAVRQAAGDVPLTVKMRKGIDADHLTYLEAGRIAEGAGVASIALHARTAAEFYSGTPTGRRSRSSRRPSRASRCSATATSGRPTTRCAWSPRPAATASSSAAAASAVRGCSATWPRRSRSASGRDERVAPDARPGRSPRFPAPRRAARRVLRRRGRRRGCRDIRKHVAWYFKGYPVGGETACRLATVDTLAADRRPARAARRTSSIPGRQPRASAAAPAARSVPPCPTAGSTAASSTATHRAELTEGGRAAPSPVADPIAGATGYADADRERWLPEQHSQPPQRLRARPRTPAALERAAPARREDAGAQPDRRSRLRAQPPDALPRGRAGRPRARRRPRLRPRHRRHRLPRARHRPSAVRAQRRARAQRLGARTSAASRATPRRCAAHPARAEGLRARRARLRAQPHAREPRRAASTRGPRPSVADPSGRASSASTTTTRFRLDARGRAASAAASRPR